MTPKLTLLLVLIGAALLALRTARARIAGAVWLTAVEFLEACFWGYTVYLLIAIPLNLTKLADWASFLGLLGFIPPLAGTQVLALLAGTVTAAFRFFETPGMKTRRPDEFLRGRKPLKTHAAPKPGAPPKTNARRSLREILRSFLERLSKEP